MVQHILNKRDLASEVMQTPADPRIIRVLPLTFGLQAWSVLCSVQIIVEQHYTASADGAGSPTSERRRISGTLLQTIVREVPGGG